MTHTPLLGIYPKELKTKIQTDLLYTSVHWCGINHNSRKAETNPSVQQQMRINKIWYVHKMEYYSAIKRNEIWYTLHNTDKPWKHHVKWKKPHTRGQILMIPLMKYLHRQIQRQKEDERLQGAGERSTELVLNEEFLKWPKSLGNSGDACISLYAGKCN